MTLVEIFWMALIRVYAHKNADTKFVRLTDDVFDAYLGAIPDERHADAEQYWLS